MICSDSECAEESRVEASTLEELERLMCDCGCALEIIAWPDWVDDGAEVVTLRRHRPDEPPLHAAA